VDAGLVEAGEEEKVEGRVRRSYTLTHDGHAALAAEAGRLRRAAHVVETSIARPAT
jgi:DNA-binding PadR family transcriptional regulator